ncbi:MAG: M28 family peptidase, partial [Candidatus Zixiibacteriota bacterium]
MLKMRLILLVFCSLMQGSAYSGDLCLLTIDGYEQLEAVRQTVDHAHGIIADKFIVYVNTDQYRSLKGAGVDVKLLVKDCRLEDFYLVLAETERSPKTALELAPLYSAADSRIVKLQKSSTGILAREGYVVLPLIEKNTPFFYTQAHSYNPTLVDYPTDSIADMVSLDSLYSYLTRLQGFYTRFTPTDSCDAARDWIRNKFQSFGYSDVTLQHFLATREDMNVFDEPTSNVICRKIGTEQPDKWIIIGGHYDSFADGCYTYLYAPAPGADCNASGTSAVLELARVFKDIEFSKSLMFVTFGGEEQWMDGSEYMAQQMYEDSIDIEFMLNFDIIGYEANGIPEFWIAATTNWAYGQVFVDAASRINDLLPIQIDSWLSDEASFTDRGYNAVAVWEHEIHPQMHTIYDNSTSIDFGYMTKFVEMSAAAVPVVDRSAAPTVCRLLDVGDGQSLRAVWDSCYADYSYKVAYDVKPSDFADTVDVPPLSCFHDITGLTEGVEYYATVLGMPGEGYPPFLYVVSQMTPLSIPRTPAEFTAEPDFQSVTLSWKPNTELDLNHYKLLKKPIGFGWVVVDDGCTDTTFADTDVIGHQQYVYAVLAVDNDLNESDTAWSGLLIPATFDGGILLVDETQSGGYNPTT